MDSRLLRAFLFLGATAFGLVASLSTHAEQILGASRISNSSRVTLSGGPTLGKWQGNKYTATPDILALPTSDQGSTGDVSGMSTKPLTDGTIARTLAERMRDWVSVRDYGVKGDGTTDDTAALKALTQRVRSIHKAHIYFPCGNYKITNEVIWDTSNNLSIDGRSKDCVTIMLDVKNPAIRAFVLQNGDGSVPLNQAVCGGRSNQEGPCGSISNIGFSQPPGTPTLGNAAIASYRDIDTALNNIRTVGYYRPLSFFGSYGARISGGTFIGSFDASVWFANDGSGNNAIIDKNYFVGGGRGTSTACIDLGYQAQQPQITNNDLEYCYIAVRSRGSHGTKISGNYMESSEILNLKFDGSNSTSSTTGFNASWTVTNNLFAKPKAGRGDTYENVNGIRFDGNILPDFAVNWSTTALRVDMGRTNTAFGTGTLGTPINPAPYASGMLAVGTSGAPAKFTSNGSDLFVNAGTTNSAIVLRPNGAESAEGQASALTGGFQMTAGAILSPQTFASLPTCSGTTAGYLRWITDAPGALTYNSRVTAGGGTSSLLAFCNGSSWTAH